MVSVNNNTDNNDNLFNHIAMAVLSIQSPFVSFLPSLLFCLIVVSFLSSADLDVWAAQQYSQAAGGGDERVGW